MEVYTMTNGGTTKVYSSKEKLLEGYIKACKTYCRDYPKSVCQAICDIKRDSSLSEEHRQDLLNYIREEPYKGIFSLNDLANLDVSFVFDKVKIDD